MSLPRVDIGPVVMSNVGDSFTDGCRIAAVVWEGATTAGDTVEIRSRVNNSLLWRGRTSGTQTYLGINLGPKGEHAPNGFYLSQISAGTVLVYITQA